MNERGRKPAPDQGERDAAIAERRRNVLIDAGAGTGKTTILVDRLIEMVAPSGPEPAVPIGRLAAVTFTRKAAGELRLRIRERLLAELAVPGLEPARDARLRDALAGLDTAYVGTIHSFADHLLRLRPVEAALSPSYEIVEDEDDLVRETFEVLMHAVENGTLAAELAGKATEGRADEATRTILLALPVGLLAESREGEWHVANGLDALVAGFIRQRDVPPPAAEPAEFDAPQFRAAAEEFLALTRPVRSDSVGATWLERMVALLRRLRDSSDPLVIMRDVRRQLRRAPAYPKKGATFANDPVAWKAWQRFVDENAGPSLRDRLCAPADRWMATHLVRLFAVVVALYEKVKGRRRALDQLDLLVKLRDLLVRDRAVRGEFQRMFDHIFVDEFQDTDPLQAEVVLFLCEREPIASRWDEVILRDGALTLVGDPKQSVYRFRRADVAIYDRVRRVLARAGPLEAKLSANFRSVPSLIGWLNDRFDRVLGIAPGEDPFDPRTGTVFQQRLAPGREGGPTVPVHVLPFDFPDARRHKVDEYRTLEGQVLARYLRWLVETSDVRIEDPLDRRLRRVRHGDIAVLAISTWRLSLLFPSLDAESIPYASRGGRLFLSDPLHRQFLLGLRAIADRDDGVAEAALVRPPFFAIDLADVVLERDDREAAGPAVRRVQHAREIIRELRRRRFDRPPSATARDLLEETAFGRAVAVGPNGAQRLARLRELCLLLEQTAADDGLDYDAATARLRAWVDEPVQLDPPYPVGAEAVQVLTVHQAKGLEFPVVVLWDGKGQWDMQLDLGAWHMERDGRGWMMNLDGLYCEEPGGLGLWDTEKAYLDAERRRVVYVAATRARDLLVIPRAGAIDASKFVCGALLDGADPQLVRELEEYRPAVEPRWAREVGEPGAAARPDSTGVEREVAGRWAAACAEAARPRFRPASVSGEARAAPRADAEELEDAGARKPREGRFGSAFGHTVHRAIGLVLREGRTPRDAVLCAAGAVGLAEHVEEAAGDVGRAVEALRAEGVTGAVGPDLQIEYPVAASWNGGVLLGGYVDIVAVTGDRLDVIDFKSDAPPAGPVEATYPEYAAQVRLYGGLLEATGVAGGRRVRCGLLFTADGVVRWVA